jgi:DNA-binding response OmpR family regulator
LPAAGESPTNQAKLATVLLIDDSPVQLRAREAVLHIAGFDTHIATTVDSALALLRSGSLATRIDAVITDHIMPQANGAEFVRELRRINSTVPVIVISGMPEAENDYQGLNVIFRSKPCPPEELIAVVQAAVSA